MTVLSLTTDFGIKDGFVGVLKGVIYGIAPDVKIVDITHTISPQNVREGSYALWRHAPFFPPGSVHVAVVDPGVGTSRRPIGARLGDQFYIAPDNGLLTPLILDAEAASAPTVFVHLDNPNYWLKNVSQTFHGRDIFSPTGAYLAAGVPLDELGTPIDNPILLDWSQPEKTDGGWWAHVTVVDVFGNMTTDLPVAKIADLGPVVVRLKGHEIDGIVPSYGHRQPGELVSLVDSEGYVEVAVVNGSAAKTLNGQIGDIVEVVAKR